MPRQTFEEYLKAERAAFAAFITSLNLPSARKVKAENFVIAFDQLLEAYTELKAETEKQKQLTLL